MYISRLAAVLLFALARVLICAYINRKKPLPEEHYLSEQPADDLTIFVVNYAPYTEVLLQHDPFCLLYGTENITDRLPLSKGREREGLLQHV
jgi:hypothetical protein